MSFARQNFKLKFRICSSPLRSLLHALPAWWPYELQCSAFNILSPLPSLPPSPLKSKYPPLQYPVSKHSQTTSFRYSNDRPSFTPTYQHSLTCQQQALFDCIREPGLAPDGAEDEWCRGGILSEFSRVPDASKLRKSLTRQRLETSYTQRTFVSVVSRCAVGNDSASLETRRRHDTCKYIILRYVCLYVETGMWTLEAYLVATTHITCISLRHL
jgi:hypothetical protein